MRDPEVTTRDLVEDAERNGAGDDEREPLLSQGQTDQYSDRWEKIQATFVDKPKQSVEQADELVADLMQQLAATFSEERERLEDQWASGDDVSTEDLRIALTRYRSFFGRLLSA
jgi:polyhydroxyalkanoate synthesis regulator phasin